MKVLLIGDYPPPLGGIAVHVRQLHEFLRERGVTVKVLDIGKGESPVPDVLSVKTPWALARELRNHVAQGYLIHLHTSGNNAKSWTVALGVGAITRAMGGRAIITLHSGLLPGFLAEGKHRVALAWSALAGYDHVVAVSPVVRQALLDAGLSPGRVGVHPAFLTSAVRPGTAPAAVSMARERFSTLLAYAHHPSAVYGRSLMLDALVKLAKRRKDTGLLVFGPGADSAELLSDVALHGLSDRVVTLGELPHEDALAAMQASDVFVRPTLADGDAISVRESLALGVRCVASDAAPRPEGVVTFKTANADDLCRALQTALVQAPPQAEVLDAGYWILPLFERLDRLRRRSSEIETPTRLTPVGRTATQKSS